MTADIPNLTAASRQVYCLCAEWCGVCREWRAKFDALAATRPQERFEWVDVDHKNVLDYVDIETFPVLLIAEGSEPIFCGVVQPTALVVERLLDGLQQPAAVVHPGARPLLDLFREF